MNSKNLKDKLDNEIGSTNVYADLGRVAAGNLLVNAQLVSKISEILEEQGLTQIKAAALLGIPQPKLSSMLRGQFRGLSERKLMDCLTRLGQDIQIHVRHAPKMLSGLLVELPRDRPTHHFIFATAFREYGFA